MNHTNLFFTLCCLYVLLCSACGSKVKVASASMSGSLQHGELAWLHETNELQKGDIIAFAVRDPKNKDAQKNWLFRLVAGSGDRVEIKNGEVFVNNSQLLDPPLVKYSYMVRANAELSLKLLTQNEWECFQAMPKLIGCHLSEHEVAELKSMLGFRKIEKMSRHRGESFIAGYTEENRWNTDNFGPILIPAIGDSIQITVENKALFQQLPDAVIGASYLIREELLFVLGDNRHNSRDSRIIGYIPLSAVKGRIEEIE